MYSLDVTKPDNRTMTLYGRAPVRIHGPPPSPSPEPVDSNPHLRWHPLRGEWVTYAAYRQGRTFLPPPQYNPLAVTADPDHPTELPAGEYDIAVFDNRFPALSLAAHEPPQSTVATAPADGHCEVVVFTQDPTTSLGALALSHIELLLQVWADRTARATRIPQLRYVLPFENRGAEVGVTLHHPHGQIYAYPFVPPVPARINAQEVEFYREHGRGLLADMIAAEQRTAVRILYAGEHAIAFVPPCARYPYEAWVAPVQPVAYFSELTPEQRLDLARALKTVLLKFDGLWQRPFPYLMVWYQAPIDGQPHPEAHLHAEFYPPYRMPDRLKYLAGTEIGAGMFAMDALPEDKAKELQAVTVTLEEL